MAARAHGHRHRDRSRYRPYLPWIVAAAFTVSGVVHLADPGVFVPLVPEFLPGRTGLVYVSGVAELVCAVGLWRRDRWAGIASAALLVLVWPGNLQYAISAQGEGDVSAAVVGWIRLPLQLPLIWFALQAGRRRDVTERAPTAFPSRTP